MAKLRVYELARELNMTNKALLAKLQDMDVEVKNHMSTVADETISKVKSELYGEAKKDTAYEAKRVKPNVIRRRRKRASEAEPEPEQPAEAETQAPAEAEKAASPEAPETETVSPEAETKESPEPEEAAETTEKTEAPAAEEKTEAAPEKAEEPAETVESEARPAEADTTAEAEEGAEKAETTEAAKEAAAPEPETPETPEEKKKPAKAKTKKKRKKETPARIIQMPETPAEPEPEPTPAEAEPPAEAVEAPPKAPKEKVKEAKKPAEPAEPEEEGKKKGKRKKPAEGEKGREAGKAKTALRRKEVVEGDALYDKSFGRGKKSRKKGKQAAPRPAAEQKPQITTPKAIKRRIKVDDTIVIADLAKRMGIKANELIKTLMGMGMMVTVNQTIDFETANLVAAEFNFEVERASFEEDAILKTETDEPSQMAPRPPVVTIMGHVDHGKTSLLDVIRRTKVTEGEAGGITQHIGAYHVELDSGEIVFLDTPGHEAFTSMRARGAQVTDLVVLVVAADDGVMPQTIEAIDHSRAAGVPLIVAVNKIDKNNAEPDRIKREIAEKGLVPEDWGGDTMFVPVSAKEQIGIDDLLEMILLQAEVLELKANHNKLAKGHVIESKMDTGRGPVATLLVQEGTLKTGDSVVCGMYYGKIRAMYNDRGQQVQSASPSYPVEIVGLSGVPMAGDEFVTLTAEKDAKQVSEHRLHKQRSKNLARSSRMSLDKLYEKMMEGEVKDLNLIIKADVQGSIEALKDSLTKLSTEEVKISVVHSAAGPIHESDVSLAAVSNAIIIGFNVRPSAKVVKMAEEENVDIRYYDVIYNTIKDIKDAMVGLMESKFEEKVLGRAEVRDVFHVPSVGTIAGCYVTDGKIRRGMNVRLIRDGIVTFDGKIGTLRRFKDDVKEVAQNYECGLRIENYNDIKVGDVLENYYFEEIKPEMA
ncbi:MAG: translation initiation factor IF-2 [Desulfobacterales bacterium]|nr:translation initiation factor IF-2 [Desulfobacterales bacterium]